MRVDRLSVTLDPKLGAAVARAKLGVSAWITDAAADRVRNEQLGRALAAWEAEGAPFTREELDAAARSLGLPRRRRAKKP